MEQRLFSHKKAHSSFFKLATYALVFSALFFGIFTTTHAQNSSNPCWATKDQISAGWGRPIDCYKTLWGSTYDWTPEQIKTAQGNGLAYLGLKPKEQGGYDETGAVKKISVVATLLMDLDKIRGWDMVGGDYYNIDVPPFKSNKKYLRFITDAFIVRVYQKEGTRIINESWASLQNSKGAYSFMTEGAAKQVGGSGFSAITAVNQYLEQVFKGGKPLDFITKYSSGAGFFSNFFENREDGYTVDGEPANLGTWGAGIAGVTKIIPGIGRVGGAIVGYVVGNLLDNSKSVLIVSQTANLGIDIFSDLKKGEVTYVEFWYAGADRINTSDNFLLPAGTRTNTIPPKNQPEGSRIKYFIPTPDIKENLDGDGKDLPYFQIGPTITFTTPANLAEADVLAQAATNELENIRNNIQTNEKSNSWLPACDILNGWRPVGKSSGSFLGCIAQLTYFLVYRPIAWFAGIMGSLFDFFLGYSLDDSSYRAEFAIRGWQIVRDLSNIFFILILVWVGFTTALGISKSSIKSIVPQLILNALLINFSLFGTRVIIDLSNIVSRVFYNQVSVCEKDIATGDCKKDASGNNVQKSGVTKYTPVSEILTASFNPQKIFNKKVIDQASALPKGDLGYAPTEGDVSPSESEQAGYFIVVTLIGAMIMFSIAKMFWGTAFLFIGRVVGLYITMIFAPFAVLTRGGMPLVGGIKELSFGKWWSDLSNYALIAPIFIFFLYIVASLAQSDFMASALQNLDGNSFFENVLYVSIPMLIIYFMITKGVGIAEKFSGDIGAMIQKKVNGVVGGAGAVALGGVGLAAGATAFLGRNSLGRMARWGTNLKTNRKVKDANGNEVDETWGMRWATNAPNSRMARWLNSTTKAAQTGTWDARNISTKIGGKEYGLGSTLAKGVGLFDKGAADKLSSKVGLAADAGKGGILEADKAAAKRRQEARDAKISYEHLSDDQAKAVAEEYKRKQIEKFGEDNWEKHVESIEAMKTHKQKVAEAETELKNAKATGGATSADRLRISRAETGLKDATEKLSAAKTEIIKNIKDGSYTKGKEEASKIASDKELERLNKYGKIKDVKGLQTMMRGEYAKNLQEKFNWMRDLNVFTALTGGSAVGITTGILTAMIPIIGPVLATTIGTALGAAVAGKLKDQKGVIEKSLKASVDAATKGSGATSKIGKAIAELDKVNDEILKMVNKELSESFKSFDDLNEELIATALEGHKETLNKEADAKETKAATEPDVKKKRRLELEAKMLRTKSKNLDKILERQRKAQENHDRIKKETDDSNKQK